MAITFQSSLLAQIRNPVQKEAITVAFVSVLVVLLMAVFVIRPAIASAIKQVSNNKIKTELILKQGNKLKTLKYLNDERTSYEYEVNLMQKDCLTDKYDTEFVVINFNNYFKNKSGIKLDKISFEKGVLYNEGGTISNFDGYDAVLVTLKFDTDQNGIMQLINFIENFPRIFAIKTINISPSSGNFPLEGEVGFVYYMRKGAT